MLIDFNVPVRYKMKIIEHNIVEVKYQMERMISIDEAK